MYYTVLLLFFINHYYLESQNMFSCGLLMMDNKLVLLLWF